MEAENNSNKNNYIVWAIIVLVIIALGVYLYNRNTTTDATTPPPDVTPSGQVSTTPPPAMANPVQVISPNGGEVWVRGQQYNIKWNTTGVASTTAVYLDLIKTSVIISDPYAVTPEVLGGYELFHQSVFPKGLPKEGTVSYKVPDTMKPGTYQLLVWAGKDCAITKPGKECLFDLSNGLITVK
jgi:hypothetical protein